MRCAVTTGGISPARFDGMNRVKTRGEREAIRLGDVVYRGLGECIGFWIMTVLYTYIYIRVEKPMMSDRRFETGLPPIQSHVTSSVKAEETDAGETARAS